MIYDGARIVGHRGFGANHTVVEPVENTLTSCLRALAEGADSVELDASVTADGQVVAYHNFRTPDGREVHAQTAADLAARGVQRLARILAGLPTEVRGRRVGVNVELKTGHDVNEPELEYGVLDAFARLLPEAVDRHPILVSSFDPRALRAYRAAIDAGTLPRVPLGYLAEDIDLRHRAALVNADGPADPATLLRLVEFDGHVRPACRPVELTEAVETATELGADALHAHVRMFGLQDCRPARYPEPRAAVGAVREAGLRLLVWGADVSGAVAMLAAGADLVCVNHVPATARAWAAHRSMPVGHTASST